MLIAWCGRKSKVVNNQIKQRSKYEANKISVVEENIFWYKTTIISLQILVKNQGLIPATIT